MRQTPIILSLIFLIAGAGISQPSALATPPRVEITARRFTYEPDTITLKKDEPVELVLKSADVTHGLRIRELGLDLKASKNKPDEVLFTPREDGDFVGHCSVFCGAKHGTMKITVHVVD